MGLVFTEVDVQLALLNGECLNEVRRVMKRRTRAARWQKNFIKLACTAVILIADEHGQRLAGGIVPNNLILLHYSCSPG